MEAVNFVLNQKQDCMSRTQLLSWVQKYFTHVTKIEDLSSGTEYCYLMEDLCPGSVNLSKVKRNPATETQKINNFKYLQRALNNVGIDKQMPVEKMVLGKFNDNFQFLQWFRKFYDINFQMKNDDSTSPMVRLKRQPSVKSLQNRICRKEPTANLRRSCTMPFSKRNKSTLQRDIGNNLKQLGISKVDYLSEEEQQILDEIKKNIDLFKRDMEYNVDPKQKIVLMHDISQKLLKGFQGLLMKYDQHFEVFNTAFEILTNVVTLDSPPAEN